MRIKIMPLPSTIQMGQKKRTTSAAVSTTFLAQIVLNHKEIALKIQQRKTLQFCEKKTTEKLLKHYIKLGS
ncbi:hypothetical protein [Escherichia coli]|uniref:hypothetical protein n=1 Tax=Escherichia coli TaxID=562 RepID=UPI001CA3E970|nr:hypothetical protein [Escherichia coli]MBY8561190.1 hypothetical protein [Escherichia coli]